MAFINTITKLMKKDNLWVYLVLTFLAIFFKLNRFELFFGVVVDLSNVFLLIILLIFGIKRALITTIILISGYVLFASGTSIQTVFILEVAVVGALCRRDKKFSVIISEFIFWGIFSMPIIYCMLLLDGSDQQKQYYYFEVLFMVVNGVLNAFLAEIIFTYSIKKNLYSKRVMLRYKEIILHIITAAILIPFIINIFVDLVNSYDSIYISAESSAQEIFAYLSDDLKDWDERAITNLQLSGIIEKGLLEESIVKAARYKTYNIHIKDKNNRKILGVNNYEKDIINLDEFNVRNITDKLSQALPINKNGKYFNNSWKDGYFVYNQMLSNVGLTLEIEIPIEIYNDRIVKEYLSQFKFLLLFALFIGFISMLLNKTIFNNLTKLSIYTKDLPDKLEKDISITWPVSNILEISVLTDNIENMSINLSKNFEKLNESQRKLYELAYYDTLTMLPNRLFFRKYVEGLAQNNNVNNRFCVMFIDLNRFKIINDTWGHDTGDKLLSEVASRLMKFKSDKF
ncbi:MAG: diguanylate cyclase domain-containing protein, partial [Clostridium sp.]